MTKKSKQPFNGCYNRCYKNKRGKVVNYYTIDKTFGIRNGWTTGNTLALTFILFHMAIMISSYIFNLVQIGGKIDGDSKRIMIIDNIDILSSEEEETLLDTFYQIYEKTGMPITLYTDDFNWRSNYKDKNEIIDIKVYNKELYYKIDKSEKGMSILYIEEKGNKLKNAEYDFYIGMETQKCLSNKSLDKLTKTFEKSLQNMQFNKALIYALEEINLDLCKTTININIIPSIFLLLPLYAISIMIILLPIRKKVAAYNYFKKYPKELDMKKIVLEEENSN